MDNPLDVALYALRGASQIPFYAYGDNEAAVNMADAIDKALKAVESISQLIENPKPCERCKGSGEVFTGMDRGIKIIDECVNCGGRGYFCSACNGKGHTIQEERKQ